MRVILIKKTAVLAAVCMCLLFLLPSVVSAEAVGHLEGVVYESDGQTPLNEAMIVLELFERGKKTDTEYKSNITGETGNYKLENVPVGKYRGRIMYKGKKYKISKVDFFVHVIENETNYLSFALKKRSSK